MSESKRSDLPPVVQQFVEVQDRRNDPGAWLGGEIHPAYTAARPNRYGYVPLFGAGLSAMFVWYYVRLGEWLPVFYIGFVGLVCLAAGIKMLRKPKQPSTSIEQ